MRRYDLAIVGGGTAALVAAFGAAGLGARVVLCERRAQTGGDCLWTGCIPSKSLLAAAELAHRMRTADSVGLEPAEPAVDFARVMAHVHGARERIAPHDSIDRLRGEGVHVMRGSARFVGPGRIAIDTQELRFRTALIATGSEPVVPAIDGLSEAEPLTNESVWDLRQQPQRLLVLGGGPLGCELGQAFARLGTRVTLVEQARSLLGKEEPEAQALLAGRLADEGVELRLEAEAVRVEKGDDGPSLLIRRAGAEQRLPFDRVLVAAGRRPVTAGLGLETVGVETDLHGAVEVDDTLRTSARGIFAGGDVTATLPFTHVAGHHGRLVVANALFHGRQRFRPDAVPWVTFTDPEVARVGLTEAQARERFGDRVTVERYSYEQLDRAITAGRTHGFAKLIAGPRGRLVGATVAAPAGGEAIAELAARLESGGKLADVSRSVHAYPTFAEGPARAADEHLRARFFNDRVRRVTRPALALLRALERGR
ncbi:MAG: FAD-dependent oxidoreductase [Thermoleophilaceae bacterium]|nr:FAD-dependent oxidoreductase [Thermoleophilaceae bacterium]